MNNEKIENDPYYYITVRNILFGNKGISGGINGGTIGSAQSGYKKYTTEELKEMLKNPNGIKILMELYDDNLDFIDGTNDLNYNDYNYETIKNDIQTHADENNEIDEILKAADDIIDELERRTKKH